MLYTRAEIEQKIRAIDAQIEKAHEYTLAEGADRQSIKYDVPALISQRNYYMKMLDNLNAGSGRGPVSNVYRPMW